jgi:hypothetical protein
MIITNEIVERALVAWRKIILLQPVVSDDGEIETCRIVTRHRSTSYARRPRSRLGREGPPR